MMMIIMIMNCLSIILKRLYAMLRIKIYYLTLLNKLYSQELMFIEINFKIRINLIKKKINNID
jgi:hypothetical protein